MCSRTCNIQLCISTFPHYNKFRSPASLQRPPLPPTVLSLPFCVCLPHKSRDLPHLASLPRSRLLSPVFFKLPHSTSSFMFPLKPCSALSPQCPARSCVPPGKQHLVLWRRGAACAVISQCWEHAGSSSSVNNFWTYTAAFPQVHVLLFLSLSLTTLFHWIGRRVIISQSFAPLLNMIEIVQQVQMLFWQDWQSTITYPCSCDNS